MNIKFPTRFNDNLNLATPFCIFTVVLPISNSKICDCIVIVSELMEIALLLYLSFKTTIISKLKLIPTEVGCCSITKNEGFP